VLTININNYYIYLIFISYIRNINNNCHFSYNVPDALHEYTDNTGNWAANNIPIGLGGPAAPFSCPAGSTPLGSACAVTTGRFPECDQVPNCDDFTLDVSWVRT